MRRVVLGSLIALFALSGCEDDYVLVGGGDAPDAPRNLEVTYYGGTVRVTWELGPAWDGESFRVYSRRVTDVDYFLIAEVTNCAGGLCSYDDANVLEDETYEYYVTAYDYYDDIETATDYSVEIYVPAAVGPPAPNQVQVVALDNANYVKWGDAARSADDFAFYRVYQDAGGGVEYLLGETDSEGFLDLLAVNGETSRYFVTAVDVDGHEGGASAVADGTPRPDYHGEWMYDYFAQPNLSGFRFQQDDSTDPLMNGLSAGIHFRLEVDQSGWWLVAGSGTSFYPQGFVTTSLKCQVGSDVDCTDVSVAPTSGYSTADLYLETQTSYVLRVRGDDGQTHYGVIRVEMQGYDQNNDPLMIFDWAYQLQAGSPDLTALRSERVRGGR